MPTEAPSALIVVQVSIGGGMIFNDLGIGLITSAGGMQALSSTISDNTAKGVSAEDVVLSLRAPAGLKENFQLRQLVQTVVVEWAAVLLLQDFPEFKSAADLFNAFVGNLTESVRNGNFHAQLTTKLSAIGADVDGFTLNSTSYAELSAISITLSNSPTAAPSAAAETNSAILALYEQQWVVIAVGVVVFTCMLCCVYCTCACKKRRLSKEKDKKKEKERENGSAALSNKHLHGDDILEHFGMAAKNFAKFSGIDFDDILAEFSPSQLSAWVHIQTKGNTDLRKEFDLPPDRSDDPQSREGNLTLDILRRGTLPKNVRDYKEKLFIAAFELYDENKTFLRKRPITADEKSAMYRSFHSRSSLGSGISVRSAVRSAPRAAKRVPEGDVFSRHEAAVEAFTRFSAVPQTDMLADLSLTPLGAWVHIQSSRNAALRKKFEMDIRRNDADSRGGEKVLVSLRMPHPTESEYSNEKMLIAAFELYDENKVIGRKHARGGSISRVGNVQNSEQGKRHRRHPSSGSKGNASNGSDLFDIFGSEGKDRYMLGSFHGSFCSEAAEENEAKPEEGRRSGIFAAMSSIFTSFAHEEVIVSDNARDDFNVDDVYSVEERVQMPTIYHSPPEGLADFRPGGAKSSAAKRHQIQVRKMAALEDEQRNL
jgi:hypothetical protein